MLPRSPDESLVNLFSGNSASRGLSDLKVQLALVQAASLLYLEGVTRATASQVVEKAIREYGIEATPSYAGQLFAVLGIGSSITHGKSRFVLEHDLLNKVRKALETKIEETSSHLKSSIEHFKDLPDKINALEKDWNDCLRLRQKEKELLRVINEEKSKPSSLRQLETEAGKLRERAKQTEALKQECARLSREIKKQPSLEEKRKSVEEAIAKYEEKAKNLAQRERETNIKEQNTNNRETELAARIEKLQHRLGWVELAELKQHIKEAKRELDQLLKQLGEKRTLLDRLLHRKEGQS